ncbi:MULTISPECIES: hypothetical protein [unclassified Streptomyces]|uniref:hypothetical protein n=1 Tax=unclassified Streptomyces TaxID=2593676 RepID=UPI002366CBA2|nr:MULTISPECIES: hypothetical protein [unclassified Streptomyces]MDF3140508.1 hypothetical protein [Streptomyces sp. T21Q-yed]WDF44990.1 hypothetical protein PBV52_05860 [Streptomyces sp. T12]
MVWAASPARKTLPVRQRVAMRGLAGLARQQGPADMASAFQPRSRRVTPSSSWSRPVTAQP